MLKKLLNEAEAGRDRILSFFNDLHSFPELGFEEERTAAKLADALEAEGFTVERNVGGTTGVIGTLKGRSPGPVFALRADMDALPIDEDSGHPFSSQNRGVMHAYGPDAHSTIVLFAALFAARAGIARGTLKVLFQPAEELLTGALSMLKSGRLSDVNGGNSQLHQRHQGRPPSIPLLQNYFGYCRGKGIEHHPRLGQNGCGRQGPDQRNDEGDS